jgi:thiamine biosynthesis lipoprotein
MGTTWTALIVCDHPPDVSLIQSRLDQIESIFSTWREDSALQKFNRNPSTDWQAVPVELAELAERSLFFAKVSDGAYDPTIPPLLALWGFGPNKKENPGPRQIPSDAAISAILRQIGWQKLSVQTHPPALRKSAPDLSIDLSSLVEGYALDGIATRLEQAGYRHFLLEIGGELIARGHKSDGSPWTVGIQIPGPDRKAVATSTELHREAISTSGTYQQYWQSGDRKYSHLLNARTGRPIDHPLQSVSVKADSALQADAWATMLLILGREKGSKLAQQHQISAIFLENSPADTS